MTFFRSGFELFRIFFACCVPRSHHRSLWQRFCMPGFFENPSASSITHNFQQDHQGTSQFQFQSPRRCVHHSGSHASLVLCPPSLALHHQPFKLHGIALCDGIALQNIPPLAQVRDIPLPPLTNCNIMKSGTTYKCPTSTPSTTLRT